jgi:hypothetical protein
MTENTISRRSLLGAAATIAAAGAAAVILPTVAQSAQPIVIPTEGDAWDRLAATLNDEQMRLLLEIEADLNAASTDEQQAVIDEVKRHVPSLSVMLQLAYEHCADQRIALRGRCCSGTPVEGEYRYI